MAEKLTAGRVKILVAIADVDALVKPASPIDRHARTNTTSVYTAAQIFPMLPERLSTDLTSLDENADRLALVIEMVVAGDGSIQESAVYRALVNNHAKLAYRSVAAWLDGKDKMPDKVAKVKGMDEQLRMQDQIAQVMKSVRYLHGALDFETIEPEAVLEDGQDRGPASGTEEPGPGVDRRLHDRGQRSVRAVSGEAWLAGAAAGRSLSGTVGSHSQSGRRIRTTNFPLLPIPRPWRLFWRGAGRPTRCASPTCR